MNKILQWSRKKAKLSERLLFLTFFLFSLSVSAQEKIIGRITDANGEGLPGVTIRIVSTESGTVTDVNGDYQINATEGDVLSFSYVGFKTNTVVVGTSSIIDISLAEDVEALDEIVVIGYGTQKKSHLTGSISKVSSESLEQIAVSRVDDALVGQVSGVNVQATNGEAGSAPTITIRGVGSMAGDATPLIVVDGVIVDSDFLGTLNMNDVESFEVLKDASSSSIYGSKGSNGIIMITMKSGVEGDIKFNYSTFTGVKTGRKSEAYGHTVGSWAQYQRDLGFEISPYTEFGLTTGTDRDWQDVFIESGTISSHSFSVSGGNKAVKFSTSLNYLKDEGVLLVDDYERVGARAKLDFKINDKVSAGITISPTNTVRRRFSGSLYNVSRHMPWLPIYHNEHTIQYVDPNGEFSDVQVGDYAQMRHFEFTDLDGDGVFSDKSNDGLTANLESSSNQNPYARIVERDRSDSKFKLFSSAFVKYKIMSGLNFRSNLSVSLQDTQRKDYLGTQARRNASDGYIDEISQKQQYYIFDNFFNYDKTIGDHSMGITLGNSIEQRDYFYSFARAIGLVNDNVQHLSNAPIAADVQGFEWTKRGIGFVSRFNYAYDDKYLVSISLRRDGSSIFGSDYKYGNFPAISVGWNADRELFLEESDLLTTLKLRASYGVTGNDRLNTGSVDPDALGSTSQLSTGNVLVDYYPHLDLVSTVSYVEDGVVKAAYGPVNIDNPNLKWERLLELNLGVDFGFFNNRLLGSVDWYRRTSDQLLLNNPISATTGFANSLQNIGKVKNEGWEFELRSWNLRSERYSWNSTLLLTVNNNTLIDFAESDGQITDLDPKRPAEWINLQGLPISSFYGYVMEREVPVEDLDPNNFYRHVGQQSGLAYVKDLNGDGVLDQDDKAPLGNPYPEFIWSFTNQFKIQNFDVSFTFQGSHGAEVRNMADQYLFNHTIQDEVSPTIDDEFVVQKIFTNSIIQDASYIALRNVNIGYTFSSDLLNRVGFTNLRVYATGQNLMYIMADNYTGWSPESLDKTSPTQYGYQRGGNPIFRTVSLGLNLDF